MRDLANVILHPFKHLPLENRFLLADKADLATAAACSTSWYCVSFSEEVYKSDALFYNAFSDMIFY